MATFMILVVEDDPDILNLVAHNLRSSGFDVLTALDGYEAIAKAGAHGPDLIVLDLMLPGLDGYEVCRELKAGTTTRRIPILMLTARGEEVDRIVGLELGADDYVVKPFSPRELILRIKAILRRSAPEESPMTVWKREGLVIDFEAHRVEVDTDVTELTATEFRLLTELKAKIL